VRDANKVKPLTAIVVGLCCSGGYYAASQAREIVAGGRTEIGCIGTYCLLVDDSKFWADMGVDWKLISSGGVKGLGADGRVTQELIDDTQRVIDDLTDKFVADVAAGRGVSNDKAKDMGGRPDVARRRITHPRLNRPDRQRWRRDGRDHTGDSAHER
jgi:protease-4